MRWNCPHCGVGLAVPDEKLSSSWTFSRCYQCAGFALVRKPEVSLIKVDNAPTGEKIVLPQGENIPSMNQSATQHLAAMIDQGSAPTPQPTIIASKRRPRESTSVEVTATVPKPLPSPIETPAPFKTATESTTLTKILPVAMIVASLTALGSGIYLYRQGKSLYSRTFQPKILPAAVPVIAAVPPEPKSITEIQEIKTQTSAPNRESRAQPLPGLVVRPKDSKVMLRTGPGNDFKELGYANAALQYVVTDWKDRWFKVLIQDSRLMAWVQNDRVDLTPVSAP